MDIRQIELFVVAAEEQHFTRAAQRANIVQSGLSVAIRGLEEELGTRLFVRSTRKVELSPAGAVFLEQARRILGAVQGAKAAMAAVTSGIAGRLAIGTVESLRAFIDLPMQLQQFRGDYPQIDITIKESYLEGLAEGLRRGTLDLAFMPMAGMPQTGLAVMPLFASDMVIATARSHPLAGQRAIMLGQLAGETFIDFSTRWGTRHLVDQIFAIEGAARSTDFELENIELLTSFIERGSGIALIPEALARQRDLHTLKVVPSQNLQPLPRWELGLYYQASDDSLSGNPAAAAFKGMIANLARRCTDGGSGELRRA